MARELGSWLSGPEPFESGTPDQGPNDFPGQRLGLPETGQRSLARTGRRLAALMVDWLMSLGIAALGVSSGLLPAQSMSTAGFVVWIVLGALSVRLFSFTPGQLALGLMVTSVDHRMHVGIGRALSRMLLIAVVIPPLFTDTDGRGLQDRFTQTAVVRR